MWEKKWAPEANKKAVERENQQQQWMDDTAPTRGQKKNEFMGEEERRTIKEITTNFFANALARESELREKGGLFPNLKTYDPQAINRGENPIEKDVARFHEETEEMMKEMKETRNMVQNTDGICFRYVSQVDARMQENREKRQAKMKNEWEELSVETFRPEKEISMADTFSYVDKDEIRDWHEEEFKDDTKERFVTEEFKAINLQSFVNQNNKFLKNEHFVEQTDNHQADPEYMDSPEATGGSNDVADYCGDSDKSDDVGDVTLVEDKESDGWETDQVDDSLGHLFDSNVAGGRYSRVFSDEKMVLSVDKRTPSFGYENPSPNNSNRTHTATHEFDPDCSTDRESGKPRVKTK